MLIGCYCHSVSTKECIDCFTASVIWESLLVRPFMFKKDYEAIAQDDKKTSEKLINEMKGKV
jgi:hypothetical protein